MPKDALSSVRAAARKCRACDLWKCGTQTVFGEGSPETAVRRWKSGMVEAVLFDLGDTLVHFETSRARHFLNTGTRPSYDRLCELGFRPPRYPVYRRAMKSAFLKALVWSRLSRREAQLFEAFHRRHERLGMLLTTSQMADLVLRCVTPLRQFFQVDDEAVGVVSALKNAGLKLGLISNTLFPGFVIDDVLEYDGLLPWFPVRVYSSDVGFMKPHRQIFETALRRLGVPPERTLIVGDNLRKDIGGGSRMGMRTILMAKNGWSPRGRVRPDHTIRRLAEIPPLIQALA